MREHAASDVPSLAARCLIAWRTKKALTQTQAAALFGVDQGRYSQIELGKRRPGLLLATRMQVRTNAAVRVMDWHGEEEAAAWKAKRSNGTGAQVAA